MKKIILFIIFILLLNSFSFAAQTAVTSGDTREQAWAIETLNNTDLQNNIDAGDTTAIQNELILGSFLNNGFFETHEFEVLVDAGVVYAEIWSAANAYAPGATYNRGNYTIYNNMRYFSLIDLNTGNQPDISPTEWEVIALADFNLHGFIEGSNRIYNLDTTTGAGVSGHARIALTAGTDANPARNWVYATMNGSLDLVLATSTTEPTGPTIKLGWTEIASIATTTTQGAVNQQRFTNGLYKEDLGEGQMQAVRHKLRKRVTYNTGVDPSLAITVNGASLDNAVLTTTIGETEQLWTQMFPAFTGTPTFYVMNHPTNPVTQQYTDLNELDVDATGASLRDNTDRYALRIWGNQTSGTGSTDALYVTLPTGHYSTDQAAILNDSNYDTTIIDDQFNSTFFNICRVVFRYQTADGGTITNLVGGTDVQNKRGEVIGTVGGSGGAVSSQTEFTTAEFVILDATDPSKKTVFDTSALSPTATITLKVSDIDSDIGIPKIEIEAISGSTHVLDYLDGRARTLTIDENCTITVTNWPTTGFRPTMSIRTIQSGGDYTVTIEGISVDLTASGEDMVVIGSDDGGATFWGGVALADI